jgi:hypothetical protein
MFIDPDLVMKSHDTRVVTQCFAVISVIAAAYQLAAFTVGVEDGGRRYITCY